MANGQIKRSDIAEQDLYKEIRDSAKKTITTLNKLNVELKKNAQVVKTDLDAGLAKTTKGIEKMSKAVAKADQTMKASIKVDKEKAQATKLQIQAERELEKLKQDKERTTQQQIRTETQANREKEKQIKLQQRSTKQAQDEANAYKQLVKATRDQKNESKRLGAELLKLEQAGKKNTKEYRKLQQQYDKVTTSAKRGDQQLKKLDKTVGDNFRNVGNYRSALGKLTGALSSLGLAFGSAMVFRSVFDTIKNFDQAQANLASILGTSREQMRGLTESAKEYGSTTKFTASEVASLQTEFAKLGFTQSEIENVTSATLDLASATNTDLAEAATVVGATVRGFGLATTETARVTDVMSKSFSSSSLDMQKFSTAMASVAPIAKSAGFSIEKTTALIGTLTNNGIDASTAGTGLRNVFLEITKRGITFEQAMQQINTATDKNAKALELFGKRGAVIGTVLSQNGVVIDELTAKLEDSTGATARMAQMQMDTLGGSLSLLKSAFEGYILDQNEAGGAGEALKEVIQSLAKNLKLILNTVFTLGKAFVAFKAITILQAQANRVLNSTYIQGVRNMGVMKGAVSGLRGAFASLNKALKANLIGIALFVVINAITEMISKWQELNEIYGEVEKNQQKVAESMHNLEKQEEKEINTVNAMFEALKKTNEGSEERDLLMRKINSQYGTTLKNLESEIDFQKQLAKAQQQVIDNIKAKTEMEKARVKFELYAQEQAKSEFEVEKAERALSEFRESGVGWDILTAMFDKFGVTSQNDLIEVLNAWDNVNASNERLLKEAEDEYNKLKINQVTTNTKSAGQIACENQGGVWDATTNTCDLSGVGGGGGGGSSPKPYTNLERQIEQEQNKQIQDDEKREREKAEMDAKFRKEDLKKLKTYRTQRKTLIAEIDESLKIKLDEIDKKYRKLERDRDIKDIKSLNDAKIKEQQKYLNSIPDTIENVQNRETVTGSIDQLRIKNIREVAKIELENTDLTEGEKRKIIIDSQLAIQQILIDAENRKLAIQEKYLEDLNKNFTKEEKNKRLELLKSNKTQEEIDKAFLKFQIKQLEKLIEAKKKLGLETIDDEIKLEELRRNKQNKADKNTLDSAKATADQQIQIVQSLTEAFNALADKRIEKVQEEIDMAKKRYDNYAELAKNGNIQAQQSLATEAKIIAEANRKKEQMEKRKQRIQLASDALQAYIRNSEDPSVQNPLLKTFTDITMLTQFIQNLPFFEDGVEDTGKNGRGVDGRGGFHAILHPNERVLTKAQNALIGEMSNEDLAQLALKHNQGKLQTNIFASKNNTKNDPVVKQLQSLEKTIQNKPVTNIELERIIDGTMQIVKKTKTGNTVEHNRYKVK